MRALWEKKARIRLYGLGLTLATLTAPVSVASAQPAAAADDAAAAAELFREGKALFIEGDYQRACPKLEASYRRVADLGALLALAACHEEQGALQQAYGEFSRAEPLVKREGRADRNALVTQHLDRLRLALQPAAAPTPPAIDPDQAVVASPAAPDLDAGRSGVAVAPGSTSSPERGLFLQANLGGGYTVATHDAVKPIVPGGALLVGGTLTPGLVLGGGLASGYALTIAGPFLAHHWDGAEGWEAQLMLGGALMVANGDEGPDTGATPTGFGGAFSLGYDWRIAPEWAVGVLGRVSAAWTTSNTFRYGLVAPAALLAITYY